LNPYVSATLAMCGVLALSLAGTAYLAVAFNRRAKTDLAAALGPLAEAIGGQVDLDSAAVSGRHLGELVAGQVANGPGGIGRLFHVDVIDAAGGARWEWSSLPSKEREAAPIRSFESDDPGLEERLNQDWAALAETVPGAAQARFGFLYEPGPGHLRLSRAMRSRNDIPDAPTFLRQIDALVGIGRANRRAQGAPLPLAPTAEPLPSRRDDRADP